MKKSLFIFSFTVIFTLEILSGCGSAVEGNGEVKTVNSKSDLANNSSIYLPAPEGNSTEPDAL